MIPTQLPLQALTELQQVSSSSFQQELLIQFMDRDTKAILILEK